MRVHWIVTILTALCLVLAMSYPVFSADSIYYVSPAGDDENDGERPEDAFATIQKAIDTANPAGSEIVTVHVAKGTYRENIVLKSGVSLDGGWNSDFSEQWDFATNGFETGAAFTVVIDGGGNGVQQPCIKAENVKDVTVSGFTIKNGRGVRAGGFSIVNATCVVSNCQFSNNLANGKYGSNTSGWYDYGDSIYIHSSDVAMENCGFSDHPAEIGGNILYNTTSTVVIKNCDFSNVYREPAVVDGSYSVVCNLNVTAEILDCDFKNNAAFKAGYQVTAIQNLGTSTVFIARCTFEGNDCAISNQSSGVAIRDSLFVNNGGSAPFVAAIMNTGCDPLVTNCVFSGNLGSADNGNSAGAIVNDAASPPITNCTFYNNTNPTGDTNLAVSNLNGSKPIVANSIFWCDTCGTTGEPFYTDAGSAVTVTYSDVQGGFEGAGNIDRDPKLDTSANPDLKLLAGSPCIDAGDNTVVKTPPFDERSLDLEGYPRRYDDPSTANTGRGNTPFVDMGAYEFGSSSLTGSLTVTITSPAPTGAQWRVDGGDWHNSGETQTGLTDGNHTVSYKNIAGWTKPANYPVTITAGQEQTITVTYAQQTGALTVTIEPAEAVTAGAQWRVGDGAWLNSGETQTGISVGNHTIDYKPADGWSLPKENAITILNEETITASGTYTQQTGDLKVTIQSPSPDGAQWRVGDGTWHNSGETQSGLIAGSHTVSYKVIPGWTSPENDTVEITDNALTEINSGLYIEQTGSLRVTIQPAAAATAGARWRVDGGDWRGTGYMQSGLTVGYHIVEFEEIADWAKTGSQIVSIDNNQTTDATGNYTRAAGWLTVTIDPGDAGTAGAQWRVNGGEWLDSGETQTGLATGDHLVEYNTVFGWTTPWPGFEMVAVSGSETTKTSATYVQQTGSLTVAVEPEAAVTAGAQWRLDGGAWQNAGKTISNVGVGSHTVSFQEVDGWTAPEAKTVDIEDGKTTSTTGTYTEGSKSSGDDDSGGCFIRTLTIR